MVGVQQLATGDKFVSTPKSLYIKVTYYFSKVYAPLKGT